MLTLEQQLSRLDLNLLVSLNVLIKECNVSRSAEALYLSQPTMSRILGRLRDLFDDPLFYRESNGLIPTQTALDLQEPLEELLRSAQRLISQTAFTPELCDQTFIISLPPLMSSAITPFLAKKLNELAPHASLIEFPAAKDPKQHLLARQVDFTIHVELPSERAEIAYEIIGDSYPTFYVSPNHPLANKPSVSLEDCVKYRFIDMNLDIRSPFGKNNPVDNHLAKLGLERDIMFKSGQLQTLLTIMQDSDVIMVSTDKLSKIKDLNNKMVPVFSLDYKPEFNVVIYLMEHKRTLVSAAHNWFKELIISTVREQAF